MSISQFIKENGINGAVFDMDGTLTDSMGKWSEIYGILFNYFGVEFNREILMRLNHIPMKNRIEVIIKEFSLNADPQKTYEYWVSHTAKYYQNTFKIKPYMSETLEALNAFGVKCGIATASDRACAQAFIKSNNLDCYITEITSLDEVSRPKSFPDIYLKASEKLGVQPCECVVFEDALTAIRAAKSGGFKVCGVQDDCSAKDAEEIKAISDFIIGF